MASLMVVQVRQGDNLGWLVPTADADTSGLAGRFIQGTGGPRDVGPLRQALGLAEGGKLPVIVELDVTAKTWRQLMFQQGWRKL